MSCCFFLSLSLLFVVVVLVLSSFAVRAGIHTLLVLLASTLRCVELIRAKIVEFIF